MKVKNCLEVCGNGIMYVLSITQTRELFEIVSLSLSIFISLLIIISKMISWFKEAKKDGVIESKEIKEAIDIIINGASEIEEKLKDKENN